MGDIRIRRKEDGEEEAYESGFILDIALGKLFEKGDDGEKEVHINGQKFIVSKPNVHGQREVSDGENKYNFEKRGLDVDYVLRHQGFQSSHVTMGELSRRNKPVPSHFSSSSDSSSSSVGGGEDGIIMAVCAFAGFMGLASLSCLTNLVGCNNHGNSQPPAITQNYQQSSGYSVGKPESTPESFNFNPNLSRSSNTEGKGVNIENRVSERSVNLDASFPGPVTNSFTINNIITPTNHFRSLEQHVATNDTTVDESLSLREDLRASVNVTHSPIDSNAEDLKAEKIVDKYIGMIKAGEIPGISSNALANIEGIESVEKKLDYNKEFEHKKGENELKQKERYHMDEKETKEKIVRNEIYANEAEKKEGEVREKLKENFTSRSDQTPAMQSSSTIGRLEYTLSDSNYTTQTKQSFSSSSRSSGDSYSRSQSFSSFTTTTPNQSQVNEIPVRELPIQEPLAQEYKIFIRPADSPPRLFSHDSEALPYRLINADGTLYTGKRKGYLNASSINLVLTMHPSRIREIRLIVTSPKDFDRNNIRLDLYE